MPEQQPDYLSTNEIANDLGVHRKTVIEWINNGLLKATRIGRQWRVARADYNEFVGRRTPTVNQAAVPAASRFADPHARSA